MLGKLARWLILMGYDAAYGGSTATDLELLSRAMKEGRVFLTRDRRIPPVAGLTQVVIRTETLEAQLKETLSAVAAEPDPARWFTRCAECNVPLQVVPRERALALVPPKVRELDTTFRRCGECGRVYWDGTHVERARQKLARWGLAGRAQSPDLGSGATP